MEKLYIQLRKVRINGYSTNEAETFHYVYGVGAPILDKQNRAIAAISLSGTKSTINIKTIPDLAEKITLEPRNAPAQILKYEFHIVIFKHEFILNFSCKFL